MVRWFDQQVVSAARSATRHSQARPQRTEIDPLRPLGERRLAQPIYGMITDQHASGDTGDLLVVNDRAFAVPRSKAPSSILLALIVFGILAGPAQARSATDGCPVTLPSHWPAVGTPWSSDETSERGWYGSSNLAALLPNDGVWVGMGPERDYRDKFWWWRAGYDAHKEPNPDLTISAVRLDGLAPPVEIENATNAYGKGWHAMLVGMGFPTKGCWEIRGTYNGAQQLIVVVFVTDE